MMKQTAIAESKVKLAEAQTTYDIKKLEREAAIKKELMQYEFDLNMKLKQMELDVLNSKDKYKEDRKDERTKIQATQQSRLIDQRKNNGDPQDFKQEQQTFADMFKSPEPQPQQAPQMPNMNFESSGNDVLSGFGTGQFEPK